MINKYTTEEKMFPKIYKILLFMLFASSFTFSQTGRISGKVTDQQTGEPLIGTNILIIGTSLGAASDVNGEYLITSVTAGEYSAVSYTHLTLPTSDIV